jgi:uncharacterized membrane protein (DUF373 family)
MHAAGVSVRQLRRASDLGESLRVVLMSVTEGEDKPLTSSRAQDDRAAQARHERTVGEAEGGDTRGWVARGFTLIEDVVYVGLGALLAASALVLLATSAMTFGREMMGGTFPAAIIGLLDRLLLILMIVELLYTIQVSFREHALVPEPFLIVGLIAAIRRILVVTAEFGSLPNRSEDIFRASMIELGVLTAMSVALVASLMMLRGRHPDAVATRVS